MADEQNDAKDKCYFCTKAVKDLTPFACGHKICKRCIIQKFFCFQINQLNQVNEIQMKCQCKANGSLSLTLDQINDLFIGYSTIKAEELSCDCKVNTKLETYCYDCYHIVCTECHNNDKNTKDHLIDNKKKVISAIKQALPTLEKTLMPPESFLALFNEASSQLEEEVKLKFKATLQNIESLIKSLQILYKTYQDNYIRLVKQGVFNLKLVKLFYLQYYSDLGNAKSIEDINTLRYMNNISYMFEKINIEHNGEIDIKVNEMKTKVEEIKKMAEPIKIQFEYKELSRNYQCSNIIIQAHTNCIDAMIQFDDETLVTGSKDSTIILWKNQEGEFKKSMVMKDNIGRINDLIKIDNQNIMGAENQSGSLKLWTLSNNSYLTKTTLPIHQSGVNCLLNLGKGRILSGGKDCEIKIIEVDKLIKGEYNQEPLQLKGFKVNQSVYGLLQLKDQRVCVRTKDKLYLFKEQDTNSFIREKGYPVDNGYSITSVCELINNKLAIAMSFGKILIIEDAGFLLDQTLEIHERDVNAMIQLKDETLVSASTDHSIGIWKLDKDKKYKINFLIADYHHGLYLLLELLDGQLCAACSNNNLVFWRCRNDKYKLTTN